MTSKGVSQRPQKTSARSHYDWLMDVARWCGIHWEISSMHTTAENAIMVAADQKDEIEQLTAANAQLQTHGAEMWAEVKLLRAERDILARHIMNQPKGLADWACDQCVSDPSIIVQGFVCGYHRALALQNSAHETRLNDAP